MDYGKLAYLKTEDLAKQVDSLRTQIETAPFNCLAVLDKRPVYFSKSLTIEEYTITAKKLTTLTLQYKILLSSESSETFNFSIYINNVRAEIFTDYIGKETKSFTFTIVAEGVIKGDNVVSAVIEFSNAGQYNLLCSEINAMGNNIYESVKTINVDVVEKSVGVFFAASKPEDSQINIINQNMQSDYISPPYYKLNKLGKSYVLSNMYYQSGTNIYEKDFYAYIDSEKNLVINLYSMVTNIISDTKILDSNVSQVSACGSLNPLGLAISYIKGNEIYTSNVTTDSYVLNFTNPQLMETLYGRIKKTIVFRDKNDLVNLFFTTDAGNSYLKAGDINKTGVADYAKMFKDKTIGLGKCENIRFKPLEDRLIMFIKQKGAVYERVLQDNKLSEPVLAAYCDELIPFKNYYLTRKNNRLNLLK